MAIMKIHPTLDPVRQLGRRGANAAVVRRSTRPPVLRSSVLPRTRARLWLDGFLLLVMTASAALIARPVFDIAPVTQTLRGEAYHLRTQWYRLRQQAMETGSIWQFDYQAGTGEYAVHCVRHTDRVTLSQRNSNDLSGVVRGRLADNLRFIAVHTMQRSSLARTSLPTLDEQAIRFFPDGSTSTARVMLCDEREELIELRIMGINGSVTIEEPRTH